MENMTSFIDMYPIFFVIIPTLIYYFGRLIGDTRVEEYDKTGYYIGGLFFAIKYLLFPILIVLTINQLYTNSFEMYVNLLSISLLVVQLLILSFVSWNVKANLRFYKMELLDKTKLDFKKKMENVRRNLSEKYNIDIENKFNLQPTTNKENWELYENLFFDWPIKLYGNKYTLLIFSLILVSINYYYVLEKSSLVILSTSIIISFFAFTMIAISFGYNNSYYPPSKIQMKDGSIFEGKILKFGKYVYILKGDKKIFINRDSIDFIEESLFKEN